MAGGIVYLVGAGCGDASLITLAGRRAIHAADVVVHDKLIDLRLLDLAPAHAERIYVGKQGGVRHQCTPQEDIHQILIDRARSGQTVVRLKGGDPLLFARGAEEARALHDANIRYEIIPGVTAALGAAATAAIPLTHRDFASAVAFVTGHEDPSRTDRVDWQALAQFPGTLVVYMARAQNERIAFELIRFGKPASTPIAFIEWAATNRQRVETTTLADVASGDFKQLHSPLIAIIGETVRLRESLAWIENRPFFGESVLILRPAHQADNLADQLESLGACVIVQPALEIHPPEDWSAVDQAIARLDEFDWLVFSSRNGVEHFLRRLFHTGRDLRWLAKNQIAAIGPGTARELSEYHLNTDLVPNEYSSEGLVEAFKERASAKRVLLVRASRGRDLLATELTRAGAIVETVVAYRQADVAAPRDEVRQLLRTNNINWIMLSSSKMAEAFFAWLADDEREIVRRHTKLVSISPVTSARVRQLGFQVAVEASVYILGGMLEAMLKAKGSEFVPSLQGLPNNKAAGDENEDVRHRVPSEWDPDG